MYSQPVLPAIPIQESAVPAPKAVWTWYQRLGFRFLFIFFLLHCAPWDWFWGVPILEPSLQWVTSFFTEGVAAAVEWVKSDVLHISYVYSPNGGSDTTDDWIRYGLYLGLAGVGCLIWTALDRNRKEYTTLYYWLRVVVRYTLAMTMALYGIIKVFHLQMPFPTLSQMMTPLGELSPMRLAWLFMGYSATYQFFGGLMEVVGGILLMFQRTALLGACLLVGVMTNVFLINVGYDVQVKLYSFTLLLMALFLIAHDAKRLYAFFILHKPNLPRVHFHAPQVRWMRIVKFGLKFTFILYFFLYLFYDQWQLSRQDPFIYGSKPGTFYGIYEVEDFRRNRQTLPPAAGDSLRWHNLIFEEWNAGSLQTNALQSPNMRYGREYFTYETDRLQQQIHFNFILDTTQNFSLSYQQPDSMRLLLSGVKAGDSLHVVLRKNQKKFKLQTNGLHWITNHRN